jgi:hypothetical protein
VSLRSVHLELDAMFALVKVRREAAIAALETELRKPA